MTAAREPRMSRRPGPRGERRRADLVAGAVMVGRIATADELEDAGWPLDEDPDPCPDGAE